MSVPSHAPSAYLSGTSFVNSKTLTRFYSLKNTCSILFFEIPAASGKDLLSLIQINYCSVSLVDIFDKSLLEVLNSLKKLSQFENKVQRIEYVSLGSYLLASLIDPFTETIARIFAATWCFIYCITKKPHITIKMPRTPRSLICPISS